MQAENAWRVSDAFNPDGEVSIGRRVAVRLRSVVPKGLL